MYGRTPLSSFSTSREVARIEAVRIVPEIDERHRYDVGRLVEKRDAAIGETLRDLRA